MPNSSKYTYSPDLSSEDDVLIIGNTELWRRVNSKIVAGKCKMSLQYLAMPKHKEIYPKELNVLRVYSSQPERASVAESRRTGATEL